MRVEEFEINDGVITAYLYADTEKKIHLTDFEAFLKETDRLYYELGLNLNSYGTLTILEYLEHVERYIIIDDLTDYINDCEKK